LTDERDGQTYRTVKIGEQWWMAENLNYDYGEGVYEDEEFFCKNGVCNQRNSYENYDTYGHLYTWKAAMDGEGLLSTDGLGCGKSYGCSASGNVRGVCPEGWHLPSKSEFETLITTVGGKDVIAKKLRSTSGWGDSNGTDDYGFSGLPAGLWYDVEGLQRQGTFACYWSSTETNEDEEECTYLTYTLELRDGDYALSPSNNKLGYSVRCVKD
jgi:uncharacterized protein (TIGR02145 family)